jgi:hypothetical protein
LICANNKTLGGRVPPRVLLVCGSEIWQAKWSSGGKFSSDVSLHGDSAQQRGAGWVAEVLVLVT